MGLSTNPFINLQIIRDYRQKDKIEHQGNRMKVVDI